MNKHALEELMALHADGGVIVEIGCGHGNGLVALYRGTTLGRMLRIFAVDPYDDYTDLNGAHYGPGLLPVMKERIAPFAKSVVHLKQTAIEAGQAWDGVPIALVWVDLTDNFDHLKRIFDTWERWVIPGGHFVFTGTEYAYKGCGAREMMAYAQSRGNWQSVDVRGQNVAAVLRKDTPRRAVFWIACGDSYVKEAATSALSVRENMRTAERWLFCHSEAMIAPGIWHTVKLLPERKHGCWYLDHVRYLNIAISSLAAFDEILFLDSDTFVARPCDDIFLALQQADLALGHGAERDHHQGIYGAPAAFTTPMIGVNLFRNNEKMRGFFKDWYELYKEHAEFYGDNDQLPLRDLLWVRNDIRLLVLPPEYAMRHNFGCWTKGMVRIVHGRLPEMDGDLKRATDDLNADHTMRLWHPRFGLLWSVEKERAGRMKV